MKKQPKKQYSSFIIDGASIYELIYQPKYNATKFVTLIKNKIQTAEKVNVLGEDIYTYPANSVILKNRVVLFPSNATEYKSDSKLIEDIKSFIHKYLETSPFFEKIVPFYILFTWIYDNFKELPYLRAIADYGQGKSRFLKTIGSICYKPMFTVGATTTAPIFRLISQFKGTLILDEADYRYSDTNVEIIKILNNGFQEGMSILRCSDGSNNYDLQAFDVFCPKIVATRNRFADKALESRFLVEYMDGKLSRKDIPLNLDDEFEQEALEIRNKCLMWRLKNFGKIKIGDAKYDNTIEPRLNQIVMPLMSIINDPKIRQELRDFIKDYNKELTADRGFSFEAPILEIIIDLIEHSIEDEVTMGLIAENYNEKYLRGEKQLSPRKIGSIVREKLRLKTIKMNLGYVIDKQHYSSNIERLCAKYDINKSEQVNVVNVDKGCKTEFQQEIEKLSYKDLPI